MAPPTLINWVAIIFVILILIGILLLLIVNQPSNTEDLKMHIPYTLQAFKPNTDYNADPDGVIPVMKYYFSEDDYLNKRKIRQDLLKDKPKYF